MQTLNCHWHLPCTASTSFLPPICCYFNCLRFVHVAGFTGDKLRGEYLLTRHFSVEAWTVEINGYWCSVAGGHLQNSNFFSFLRCFENDWEWLLKTNFEGIITLKEKRKKTRPKDLDMVNVLMNVCKQLKNNNLIHARFEELILLLLQRNKWKSLSEKRNIYNFHNQLDYVLEIS